MAILRPMYDNLFGLGYLLDCDEYTQQVVCVASCTRNHTQYTPSTVFIS